MCFRKGGGGVVFNDLTICLSFCVVLMMYNFFLFSY